MGTILRSIIEQEIGRAGLQLSQDGEGGREIVREMGCVAPDALLAINIDGLQVDIVRNAVRTAIGNIRDQALCQVPGFR